MLIPKAVLKDSVTEFEITWKTPPQHIRAKITNNIPSHLWLSPFVKKYGAPPLYPPFGSFSLYSIAIVDSIKAVEELSKATTHIQNTDPGPPTDTAATTPARFPTPTLDAVLIQKAWNEETSSFPALDFSVKSWHIWANNLNCTPLVLIVKLIAPGLGGINLEDISAPRCIEIETRLKEELDIPVFHDDQHGTAIVVAAGLINALKVVNKKVEDIKVVVNGAGAAGSSIIKLIKKLGAKEVIAVDRVGILRRSDKDKYDFSKKELAEITNSQDISGGLAEAIVGADVFVGVSAPNLLSKDMVRSMNRDAIVFAMANPTPEIMPEDALEAGAAIVGTGRSDYPNQINNVLVFPGLFKGALRAKSKKITEEMKIAAAEGLASLIKPEELRKDYIIPDAFDKRVAEAVASAVEKLAKEQGICRG